MPSILRATLRQALRLIPRQTALPILRGPLRGMRWIKGAADNGCWAGTYEKAIQDVFLAYVKPGFIVYDIGANAGFYTLLASRLVGASGRVHAFEPLPENLSYLRRHVEINRLSNVRVAGAAVSSAVGEMRFSRAAESSQGRLTADGEFAVQTVTLDSLPPPDFIKMDIEGAELDALRGGAATLKRHAPVVVLATHNYDLQDSCRAFLQSLGYVVSEITGPGADTGPQRDFLCVKG